MMEWRGRGWTERILASALVVWCVLPLLVVGEDPVVRWSGLPWVRWEEVAGPEAYFHVIGGAFTHTMILLVGGTVAFCTSMQALAYTVVRRSSVTAIISLVLFWAAFVSLTLSVSAEGVGLVAVDKAEFVPFTWLLTRTFNTSLLVVGGGLLLVPKAGVWLPDAKVMVGLFVLLGVMASVVVWVTLVSPLPSTVYSDRLVKRPWDLPATIMLVVGLVWIFRRVHEEEESYFSLALWMSLIPMLAAQLYLMFGSLYLFDDVFNIAYLLRASAFGVLFVGLTMEYGRVVREEERLGLEVTSRERRLGEVLETVSEAIIGLDAEQRVVVWNRAAEALFGWTEEMAKGQELGPLITDSGDEEERLRRCLEETQEMEILVRDRQGRRRLVEFTSRAAGDELRTTVFARDLTERKQLEEKMIQMDRMVTIGTLAAGVGHEIGNPLAYMNTNLEWALEELGSEAGELREALVAAREGGDRIERILGDLRMMSGFRGGEPRRVSLSKATEMALRMTAPQLSRCAEVEVEVAPEVWVMADEGRLTQVVTNLLVNACHAVEEEKGEKVIRVRVYERGEEACVEVSDTGPGVGEEKERIFDAFYTTKEPGKGSGLGLSLSRQIVEEFEGTLEVEDNDPQGAVFRVRLPRVT